MNTPLPTPSPRALTLNEELVALRKAERRARHKLCRSLVEMAEGLYVELGYATIVEYGYGALKLSKRVTLDLIELGRRLPELPHVDAAMAAGELDWTKARDIARVATAETDRAWADYGKTANSRDVENAVQHAKQGDGLPPADGRPVPGPARRRRVLEFESVDADALDLFVALVRADTSSPDVTVEEAIVALVRKALADRERSAPRGEELENVEPYRIVVTTCATCGSVASPEAEVSDAIASESSCDAEVVDLLPGPTRGHATRTIPPATRRFVLARDGWQCRVPGCRLRLGLHIHHLQSRSLGGDHAPENLLSICPLHHRRAHQGVIAIERVGDTLVVRRADGTVLDAPWPGSQRDDSPRGETATRPESHGGDSPRGETPAPYLCSSSSSQMTSTSPSPM